MTLCKWQSRMTRVLGWGWRRRRSIDGTWRDERVGKNKHLFAHGRQGMSGNEGHVGGGGFAPGSEYVGAGGGDKGVDGGGHVFGHGMARKTVAVGNGGQKPAGVGGIFVKRGGDGLDDAPVEKGGGVDKGVEIGYAGGGW